ncbi:hypothetical protein BH20ACI4_BH20ACI4_25500 [soil metagenome]
MSNKNVFLRITGAALFFAVFGAAQIFAQPSDAQLKKVLTSPKTVSVTLGGAGKIEWSKTYKKYVWTRNFTAKLKTDTAGEFLIVKGYAAYDVVGKRYVFRRTFTSSNSYEGKKNPTAADINQALANEDLKYFHGNGSVIDYESVKIAPAPNWEWHTPNSVSFYAVAVFRRINFGTGYSNANSPQYRAGFRWIDTVREVWRVRIYRTDEKSPWSSGTLTVVGSLKITDGNGGMIPRDFLIDQKQFSESEIERMPRATKVPLFTN